MPFTEKKSVMVVEDDESISFVVADTLESDGYRVITATNGREALERIEREGLPDLVLLDMRMPVMDGWQFASKFAELYDHQSPIVVMTAAADAAKRAQEIAADAWLGKPFELVHLQSTIQMQMRKKRSPQPKTATGS